MNSALLGIEDFDNFKEVCAFQPSTILPAVQKSFSNLDENEEIEPFLRSILSDPAQTPHGPVEIADIITQTVTVRRERGLAAFILKGKSFASVKPRDVAHQIYRLEKVKGLRYAVFAASGAILDEAREQFCSTAQRLGCGYAVFNKLDLARLFVAYGFLCPRDGRRIVAGKCKCGYCPSRRILNVLQQESLRALREAHDLGQGAGLIVLPPGSGKTRLAAEDTKEVAAKCILYVGHTHEMLDVAESEFAAVFGKEKVRRHFSGRSLSHPSKVNLSSVQLLSRNLGCLGADIFDYVVIDEFHHAAARSYRRLLERVRPRFLLGLTATPFRGDRQDILELCNGSVIAGCVKHLSVERRERSRLRTSVCHDERSRVGL